jgi:hypothetical protein
MTDVVANGYRIMVYFGQPPRCDANYVLILN